MTSSWRMPSWRLVVSCSSTRATASSPGSKPRRRRSTVAITAQRALAATDWGPVGELRVRIGIHVGDAQERSGDWYGPALNRCARLMAVGHGGQVLLSAPAAELARHDLREAALVDLGLHRLRDLAEPEHVWQVAAPGLVEAFPPLRSLDSSSTNLPSELTSFLGREREVRELLDDLVGPPPGDLVWPRRGGKDPPGLAGGRRCAPDVPRRRLALRAGERHRPGRARSLDARCASVTSSGRARRREVRCWTRSRAARCCW